MLENIKQIALTAGKMMLNRQEVHVEEKNGSNNIVTNMDLMLQKYIIEQCRRLDTNAKFIAEEQNNQILSDDATWIIDPLDGTTNFAYDYGCSAISIAYSVNKRIKYAVVYHPYLDQLFYAEKNKGAYLNGNQIHVSKHTLKDSLLAVGTSPYNKDKAPITFKTLQTLFENCRDLRRSGSAAIDLCYVASGKVDGFYEEVLAIWDYAAASLIIEEAHGKIQALDVDLFKQLNAITIVAGNQNNFYELCNMIKK